MTAPPQSVSESVTPSGDGTAAYVAEMSVWRLPACDLHKVMARRGTSGECVGTDVLAGGQRMPGQEILNRLDTDACRTGEDYRAPARAPAEGEHASRDASFHRQGRRGHCNVYRGEQECRRDMITDRCAVGEKPR